MELTFLGGARTVSGSRHLVDTGRARVLIDCGMFQGGPTETVRNRIPLGLDPRTLDAVVLTHAHLDHSGLLPVLAQQGFRGTVVCTVATEELTRLILLDSAKLQAEFAKRDARRARRDPERAAADDARDERAFREALQEALAGAEAPGGPDPETLLREAGPIVELGLDEPLYDEGDVEAVLARVRTIPYGAEREIAPGIHVTLADAGHILGSAIVVLRAVHRPGERGTRIVFSGDLGRPDSPILRDPTVIEEADFVVTESTYGGREHESPTAAVLALRDAVVDTVRQRGVLLIPSFAVGRTQEIVWVLDRLIEDGEIPPIPLYLDSPMASGASQIYRDHPEAYDEETRRLLEVHATPLDYPHQVIVRNADESSRIARAKPPYAILASNGMLTGGRSVGHASRLLPDPKAIVLFVGYQGEGTLGGHLVRGAGTARIMGRQTAVRASIRQVDGFSAHADEPELLAWIGAFIKGRRPGDPGVPKQVFLVHGDPPAQAALAPRVAELGLTPVIPAWHETVAL
jgi:metallo-beta-lactamase family protein